MTKGTIQNQLRQALLENAAMRYSLYKHELEETPTSGKPDRTGTGTIFCSS